MCIYVCMSVCGRLVMSAEFLADYGDTTADVKGGGGAHGVYVCVCVCDQYLHFSPLTVTKWLVSKVFKTSPTSYLPLPDMAAMASQMTLAVTSWMTASLTCSGYREWMQVRSFNSNLSFTFPEL